MKRRALLVAAIVLGATACGRNRALRTPFFDVVRNARERAKTLAVRHRDVLAGTTHDPLAIGEALDAILDARPARGGAAREQRWQLSFRDADARFVLEVTTSIAAPFTGTIGGGPVTFGTDALVRFLTGHYAPGALKLIAP